MSFTPPRAASQPPSERRLRYLSICSGIEAASVAWHPLGFEAAGFAEIAPFPSAVLDHRYPEVKNFGDFTKIEAADAGPIDILVGGTPCQAFSVAGLRGGLGDDRGNLALEFLRLADRLRPRWVLFENVPGLLSSLSHAAPGPCPPPAPMDMECDGQEVDTEDEYGSEELHAFSCFLAGLSEIGYGFAYRVLDAQYDGLAQRRERVFVVGYLGDWRPACAVLADRESLSWHPAPRREHGQGTAPTISARPTAGGGLGTDFDLDGGLIAKTLCAGGHSNNPLDENLIAHALAGVRRITPTEAERLQGFPDDWTKIPWRGRPTEDCPDGPRYKAVGNSMAVPVIRWLGERIQLVDRIVQEC
jgi:DNA (cytosine-5)-methyltransferase 1